MRLVLAIVAVLSLLATFPFSSVARRARCIESVRRLPTAGGTVGEVLEKRHPGFHWTYGRTIGERLDRGTPHADLANVAFESDSLVPVYAWSCSDDPVPLVLAVNGPARELTPTRTIE